MEAYMQEKLMKGTRRSHRNFLRAVAADDVPEMQKQLFSMYDAENSALSQLTSGPSPLCMVPVADGLLTAAYKNNSGAFNELMDTLDATGRSFGLSPNDVGNLKAAAVLASELPHTSGAAHAQLKAKMMGHVTEAGFENMGMCMPAEM